MGIQCSNEIPVSIGRTARPEGQVYSDPSLPLLINSVQVRSYSDWSWRYRVTEHFHSFIRNESPIKLLYRCESVSLTLLCS